MYAIIFSYGFDGRTGERYLDNFYCINKDEIEADDVLELITCTGNKESKERKRKIGEILKMIEIRSRFQNTHVRIINSEVHWTREVFEKWFNSTPTDEINRRSIRIV